MNGESGEKEDGLRWAMDERWN